MFGKKKTSSDKLISDGGVAQKDFKAINIFVLLCIIMIIVLCYLGVMAYI